MVFVFSPSFVCAAQLCRYLWEHKQLDEIGGLEQVTAILVSANISAIQVSRLPALKHQSKFRKFTLQCIKYTVK